mmetsp:Transcript_62722/g.149741  ORF Transcript_62722/g.149741 Transcript_62722/m.149741 type:complete len:252 (+) Transcript_62722:1852-2607(+)
MFHSDILISTRASMRLSRNSRYKSIASSAASSASSGDDTMPRASAIAKRHSASIRLSSNSWHMSRASVAFFKAVSTAPRSESFSRLIPAKVSNAFASHSLAPWFLKMDLASLTEPTALAFALPSLAELASPKEVSILASPILSPTSLYRASSSLANSCAAAFSPLPTKAFTTSRAASAAPALPAALKAFKAARAFSAASANCSWPRRSSASTKSSHASLEDPVAPWYFSERKSPPPRQICKGIFHHAQLRQ